MKLKTSGSILLALALGTLVLLPALAGEQERSGGKLDEEFFIVSSIDTKKQQVLLKRPTEVTELMLVTEKTAFLDEQGKPLRLSDFRAGDTVYFTPYSDLGAPPSNPASSFLAQRSHRTCVYSRSGLPTVCSGCCPRYRPACLS